MNLEMVRQDVLPGDRTQVHPDGFSDVLDRLLPGLAFAHAAGKGRAGRRVTFPPVPFQNDGQLHCATPLALHALSAMLNDYTRLRV